MERWQRGSLLLWLLGALTAACAGGSGSSGFDIRSENSAIQQVLAEQHCVQSESLRICPAAEAPAAPTALPTPSAPPTATGAVSFGPTATPSSAFPGTPTPAATPAATATPTPTHTPPTTPHIDVQLDRTAPVPCVISDRSDACSFTLPFEAQGFSSTALFRVAVRTVDPDSPWTIGAPSQPLGPARPSAFNGAAAVTVVSTSTHAPISVQAAVLVLDSPAANVPATVAELVDTGAKAAYVTAPFALEVSPSGISSSPP